MLLRQPHLHRLASLERPEQPARLERLASLEQPARLEPLERLDQRVLRQRPPRLHRKLERLGIATGRPADVAAPSLSFRRCELR